MRFNSERTEANIPSVFQVIIEFKSGFEVVNGKYPLITDRMGVVKADPGSHRDTGFRASVELSLEF